MTRRTLPMPSDTGVDPTAAPPLAGEDLMQLLERLNPLLARQIAAQQRQQQIAGSAPVVPPQMLQRRTLQPTVTTTEDFPAAQ